MKKRWELRTVPCPESPERTAHLLLGWSEHDGERTLESIDCDNPRLADLDNWTCDWACWKAVAGRD